MQIIHGVQFAWVKETTKQMCSVMYTGIWHMIQQSTTVIYDYNQAWAEVTYNIIIISKTLPI